jgi:hypothetical protein
MSMVLSVLQSQKEWLGRPCLVLVLVLMFLEGSCALAVVQSSGKCLVMRGNNCVAGIVQLACVWRCFAAIVQKGWDCEGADNADR